MNESIVLALRDEILNRIRGEYLEMPGLCLTHAQAQRLWGLDAQTCAAALAVLTGEHFLHLQQDGTYSRQCEWPVSSRPAPRNSPHLAVKYFTSGR